jgi:hypothetical protein
VNSGACCRYIQMRQRSISGATVHVAAVGPARDPDRKDFRFVPIRLDRSKLPVSAENRIFLDFADYPDGPNGGELLIRDPALM